MIARLIEFSVRNKLLVLLLTAALVVAGVWATLHIRIDAIPDLSDVQVIVITDYPGQAPQVVEDQVTYPLTTALRAASAPRRCAGFSMFETSMVYVHLPGRHEPAGRPRAGAGVPELLEGPPARRRRAEARPGCDRASAGSTSTSSTPATTTPTTRRASGTTSPPGGGTPSRRMRRRTGAEPRPRPRVRRPGASPLSGKPLVSSNQDLGSLRSLQDWYLRYPLTSVPGVAEVASIGGFVKEYQVVLRPERLLAYNLPRKGPRDGRSSGRTTTSAARSSR